jgi:hypothetical protein
VKIQFLPYFWNPLIKQSWKILSNPPNTFLVFQYSRKSSFIASWIEVISKKAKKVNLRFFLISIFNFKFSIFFQILVAPILDPKKTKRNIYLPKIPVSTNKEAWRELNEKTCYEGGRWLNETTVELHKVAYFERILHKDCL